MRYRIAEYSASDTERWHIEDVKSAVLPPAQSVRSRSAFARDRARVLHSSSFRRLAGKTQVVGPDEDDVPRTRLTHSLEVSQIAREIGALLGCDPDLTELAGLAHDIGHPPFGHNGEAALNEVALEVGGFEANAQNLRLLTRLEGKVLDDSGRPLGLNLTRASLDSVLKYPWARPDLGGKFGLYAEEAEIFGWVRAGIPARARCLESQIMDWADDVAYSVHDIEDGVHAGRVQLTSLLDPQERRAVSEVAARSGEHSVTDLETVLDELLAVPVVERAVHADPTPAGEAALLRMTSELIGRFTTGAVAATRSAAGEGPLHRYDADLVIPDQLVAEVAVLKAIAHRYVMADPLRQQLQVRQRTMLRELVEALLERSGQGLDAPFARLLADAESDFERLRVVVDQVALFTDAQAVARHRRWARQGAEQAR
jgi:dGTPase